MHSKNTKNVLPIKLNLFFSFKFIAICLHKEIRGNYRLKICEMKRTLTLCTSNFHQWFFNPVTYILELFNDSSILYNSPQLFVSMRKITNDRKFYNFFFQPSRYCHWMGLEITVSQQMKSLVVQYSGTSAVVSSSYVVHRNWTSGFTAYLPGLWPFKLTEKVNGISIVLV